MYSERRLRKFKETILEHGDHIFERELGSIVTRKPNIENMDFNVERQKKEHPLAGEVLDELYSNVIHFPAKKVLSDVVDASFRAMEQINNRPFYIFLASDRGTCFTKSNMLFAIMAMAKNKDMARRFEDFICDGRPLHGWFKSEIRDIMYIDDATFSGKQILKSFEGLTNILRDVYEYREFNFHLVLPYACRERRNDLSNMMRTRPHKISWYHSFACPQSPIINVLNKLTINSTEEGRNEVLKILRVLLSSDNFGLSLFYTDVKIADDSSVYPSFLLSPSLYDGSLFGKDGELKSIVTNCESRDADGSYDVSDGNYCPFPIYKKPRWIQTLRKSRIIS